MSLYLSRLALNPRLRLVQRELADCQAMHQRVLGGFPHLDGGGARERYGILYRVEALPRTGAITLLVQSQREPDWSALPGGYLARAAEVKAIEAAYAGLAGGDILVFRLRANPTRRVCEDAESQAGRKPGKRVELAREEDQLRWLARKGEAGGFRLLRVAARPDLDAARFEAAFGEAPAVGEPPVAVQAATGAKQHGRKARARLTFGSVLFEGRLQVSDAERFRETLRRGIGSGKAYGFGLLSVAPVR